MAGGFKAAVAEDRCPASGRRMRFHHMAVETDPLSGSLVKGRYLLLDRLGRGGEGEVYRASDTSAGTIVAIKLIGKAASGEAGESGVVGFPDFRMMRELKACSVVDSRNVVRILDSGTFGGRPFMAMELLRGRDLLAEIHAGGRLEWDRTRSLAMQVCDGLAALHGEGIVHRDIKPANIFICEDGTAKIIDLDLVKFAGPSAGFNIEDSEEIVGTPAYMAPEMLAGGVSCDIRLDIYSLGATVYQMLTGVPPFTATNYLELMVMHRDRMPEPLSSAAPGLVLPVRAEKVVAKALEKDPSRRYQSAAEMKAALEAVPAEPVTQEKRGVLRNILGLFKFLAFGYGDFLGSLSLSSSDLKPRDR